MLKNMLKIQNGLNRNSKTATAMWHHMFSSTQKISHSATQSKILAKCLLKSSNTYLAYSIISPTPYLIVDSEIVQNMMPFILCWTVLWNSLGIFIPFTACITWFRIILKQKRGQKSKSSWKPTVGFKDMTSYEFHLWKSFLYEMAIWRGPSRYQRRQTLEHCIRGPDITWAKGFLFLTRSLIFLGGIHQRSPQPQPLVWCAIAIATAINSNSNSNNNNWARDARLKPQEVFFLFCGQAKSKGFLGLQINRQ